MSAEQGSVDDERELRSLLAELRETMPPAGLDLAQGVVRRAHRQHAARTLVQLLVALARAVPDAIAIGAGRRR